MAAARSRAKNMPAQIPAAAKSMDNVMIQNVLR
jgi:hypothetical protein